MKRVSQTDRVRKDKVGENTGAILHPPAHTALSGCDGHTEIEYLAKLKSGHGFAFAYLTIYSNKHLHGLFKTQDMLEKNHRKKGCRG